MIVPAQEQSSAAVAQHDDELDPFYRELARKLFVDRSYRRFLRDARAVNRIFALTLLGIWLAYQTGSMRYGLLVARKRCRP